MWPNCNFLWIWSHLLKKFLMENFIFVQCPQQKNTTSDPPDKDMFTVFVNKSEQRNQKSSSVFIIIEFLQFFGTKYSRMNQVKLYKGCLPQTLPGPFLNTLTYLLDPILRFMTNIASFFQYNQNCMLHCSMR